MLLWIFNESKSSKQAMSKRRKIVLAISILAGVVLAGCVGAVLWLRPKQPAPPKREIEVVTNNLEINPEKLSPDDLKSILLDRSAVSSANDSELFRGAEEISKDTDFMSRYLTDCLLAGKVNVIKQAIEMNPELVAIRLDSPDAHGPLPCAVAMYGDLELLGWLLDEIPECQSSGQREGTSILHAAIAGTDGEVIQWLIDNHKALLTVKNELGQTPLHALVDNPNTWLELDMPALVGSLIEASPEITAATDASGRTALDLLEASGSVEETPYKTAVRQILTMPSSVNR